jgi:hypothetical protein
MYESVPYLDFLRLLNLVELGQEVICLLSLKSICAECINYHQIQTLCLIFLVSSADPPLRQ